MEQETQPTTSQPWRPLRALGEALRFLTIVPVPGPPAASEGALAGSIGFFPLVGALIGALLVGVGTLGGHLWDDEARGVVIVVAWAIVTAGLHLDGLSDTFDAVLSWRPRERKLEIMKDSHIGALGAIALIAVILLKLALIHSAGSRWLVGVVLAPVLGRWSAAYGIWWFPAARAQGLGRAFKQQSNRAGFVIASVTALVLALLLGGTRGLVAVAVVWVVAQILAMRWTRDLGGLTGDTYGALCEIAEVVALGVMSSRL